MIDSETALWPVPIVASGAMTLLRGKKAALPAQPTPPLQFMTWFVGVILEIELVIVPPREFCVVVVERIVIPPEGSGVITVVVELVG